ncbi:hypothetical protein Tco_0132118 [Tanacetum coccineum]
MDSSIQRILAFELTVIFRPDHSRTLITQKSTSRGYSSLVINFVVGCQRKQTATGNVFQQRQNYGFNYNKTVVISDSQSAIAISCTPYRTVHTWTKHIHYSVSFQKERCEKKGLKMVIFEREELGSSLAVSLDDSSGGRFNQLSHVSSPLLSKLWSN